MSADYQIKKFSIMSIDERDIEISKAVDRLGRLMSALSDLFAIWDKCDEYEDSAVDDLKEFYGIPEFVDLPSMGRPELKFKSIIKGWVEKSLKGTLNKSTAGQFAFFCLERIEIDAWWILFGYGDPDHNYYPDFSEMDEYEEIVKFSSRKAKS